MKLNEKRIALVTGASSGIGQAVAQLMAQNGYIVYGTSRRANYETIPCGGASYTMVPVTLEDETTIESAVQHIIEQQGRIDVLVNAAGNGIAGAVEETTAAEAKLQFDVCFLGVISMLNYVLPHMRAAKSGTVINIGSVAGFFPIPFQGMYSAAKAGLYMLTATLRMELKPFGINVCEVDPGDTRTGFTDKRKYTKKTKTTAYRQPFERALYEMIRSELAAPGPEKCAKIVLKMANRKHPPIRIIVGFGYKTLYLLGKLLPGKMVEAVIGMLYLSKDPPKDAVWTYDKQFKEE